MKFSFESLLYCLLMRSTELFYGDSLKSLVLNEKINE